MAEIIKLPGADLYGNCPNCGQNDGVLDTGIDLNGGSALIIFWNGKNPMKMPGKSMQKYLPVMGRSNSCIGSREKTVKGS